MSLWSRWSWIETDIWILTTVTVSVASFRTQVHWQQPRHHRKILHPPKKKLKILKTIAPTFGHAKKRPTIQVSSSQSSDSRHDDDFTTPTELLSNERPFKRQKN